MDHIEAIRMDLTALEATYGLYMDTGRYDEANVISKALDNKWNMLVAAIRAEDPHTTEADIRYFEKNT
jgi:hypothetical protein